MTMEESTPPATNRVIVVGMLDTMLVRERDARRERQHTRLIPVTVREARGREHGGRRAELTIQARSPYGGMFALKIVLEPDVPGAELLQDAAAETLLAFEGALQLKETFDGRLARDLPDHRGRLDRGRPTRALHLLVSQVREPNEHERRATSAVWLEGTVAEPPQIARHPELPTLQLAGTILRIASARPIEFPGLAATIDEITEVNVAIPTTHRDAELLYQAGNVVRVAGQLDCRMERQGGPSVAAKLAELDAEWGQTKAGLADRPQELRRAEAQWRRQRARFEEAPRLYVLAGAVTLVAGAPLALAETYALRQAFVQERRRRQTERRARAEADRQRRARDKAETLLASSTDTPSERKADTVQE